MFAQPELSGRDVARLNEGGIGLRMPMSNHFVDAEEYRRSASLLERHHRKENSIIISNDDLARWVRQDFPRYRLDASVIKNIKSHRKIDEALELYDSVVLPMRLNEDLDFLEKVEAKDRIIGAKAIVDSLHHAERSWPGPDKLDVLWQSVQQQIQAVAVRVADNNLGSTLITCGLNGRVYFRSYERAKLAVFKSLRLQLFPADDSGNSFHIGRNIDLQTLSFRLRRSWSHLESPYSWFFGRVYSDEKPNVESSLFPAHF